MANESSTVADYTGKLGEYEVFSFKAVETHAPNSPWAALMKKPGTQNTSSLARGNLNGSIISLMNGNLTHACDFKFIINLDFYSLIGINNPVEAIQRALQNAKLKATNRMRTLLKEAAKLIRAGIDALLTTFGFDPSGQLSISFQIGKDLARKVNEAIKWVAEKVEDVMEWVYFYQQIQQLITWLNSLPDKLKKLLQACLSNFTKSAKATLDGIKNLPGAVSSQIQSQITTFSSQLAQAAALTAKEAQNALSDSYNSATTGMPDAVYQSLMTADTSAAAAAVQEHIDNTTSADEISAQASDISSSATSLKV